MIGAALAAIWLMLTPTSATPDVAQTPPVPPTQPPVLSSGPAVAPQDAQSPEVADKGDLAQQEWAARLHAALDSAEARQGPLDGRWRLAGADGGALFVLVLSDPDDASLTGAWRDLRREGGADGSGYLAEAARTADGLDLRFTEPGRDGLTVLELRPAAAGGWAGELFESGVKRPVTMTRF